MDRLKQLISHHHKNTFFIGITILMSISLLTTRIKLTHSFHYLFLVWNIFLAIIPFAITSILETKKELKTTPLILYFLVWLAFLPNCPYIITDLMHIQLYNHTLLWLDILIISSFAFSGLLLFYISLAQMTKIIKTKLNRSWLLHFGFHTICLLSGFGVYLGRFLRYNSWEILSSPQHLITDILVIITEPIYNKNAWIFTVVFGLFLNVGYWIFKEIRNLKIEH